MNSARRATISLALFVLICFFLPWAQLSCAGAKDSLSGFDLARRGDRSLWLIPVMMALIALLGLARLVWQKMPALFALAGAVGGGISAYLMYDEQSGTAASPGVIAVQWTGLFWFGFLACIGLAVCSVWFYSKRSLGP